VIRLVRVVAGVVLGLLAAGPAAVTARAAGGQILTVGTLTAPTAYVVNAESDTVTPINTVTNRAGKPIRVGADPQAIAITPNGATAYVVNHDSETVTPIHTATGTTGKPINVGEDPRAIAITPNGATAYVVDHDSNRVTPIHTATNTAGKAITVGRQPINIAIIANGQTAYRVNAASGTVTPINTAMNIPERAHPNWDQALGRRDHAGRGNRVRDVDRNRTGDPDRHCHQHHRNPDQAAPHQQ
jgi:YVTN family beta-propeller protein